MDKKPLLSFVMPLYNGSAFIAESLNSLLIQTLKNIEIVVVDDGSVDSIEPIRKYYTTKDERIKWHTLEKNMGVGIARDFGNNKAESNIIAVNDADDISYPERAKTIFNYFKTHTKINIIHSGFSVMDCQNKIIDHNEPIDFDIENVKRDGLCYVCHSSMAYRKKIAEEIKYENKDFSRLGMDDWFFQINAYKKGHKITSINKELVIYRDMPIGLSYSRNMQEVKEIKDKYIESIGGL